MRLLSALLDVVLLPLDVAQDVVKAFDSFDHSKSATRQRIEKIEDEVSR